jgi:hypothetical protein
MNRKIRNRKPYEFEDDDDPFIVVGIDAEWVYESEGRNRILSYQFAVLNADTGEMSTLIVYTKDGHRISLERGLSMALLKARRRRVIDKVPRIDIKAAYPTALSFIGLPDWHTAQHCTDLHRLAVIDAAMTAALVEFRFPDGTPFPCLPVRASNGRGLIYPLEGQSWCTGPELVVAIGIGADITVKDG